MKHVMFSILLLSFACCAIAQTADTVRVYTLTDTVLANAFIEDGKKLNRNGENKEAIKKIEEGLSIRISIFGESNIPVANAYNWLGIVHAESEQYEQAIAFCYKSLKIKETILGSRHPELAWIYNNIGNIYIEKMKYDSSVFFHKKALDIRIVNSDTLGVATSYFNIGNLYYYMSDFENALHFLNLSLGIRLKVLGKKHLDLASTYNSLGAIYNDLGEPKKSLEYYLKALHIRLEKLDPHHPKIAMIYENIGVTYFYLEDFEKAIEYCQKSLSIKLKNGRGNSATVAHSYVNLARYYTKIKEYRFNYYEEAIRILTNTLGENHHTVATVYGNLGMAHVLAKNFDKAAEYLVKSLEMRLKLLDEDHYDVIISYDNLGYFYDEIKQYDLSIKNYQKGLELSIKKFGKKNSNTISLYNNLASAYKHNWQFEEAILNYKSSMLEVDEPQKKIKSFNSLKSIYLHYYKQNHDALNYLDTALDYAQQAVAALEYQQKSITSEGSKAQLADNHYAVYEGAIETSLLLADLDHSDSLRHAAFDYAERSKAALLRAKMKESEALGFAGIPDSLLQQEYDLRVDISWRERQRQEKINAGQSETDSTILALSGKIFDLRQRYDTLKTRFEHEYPEYYRAKYDLSTLSLKEVQQNLLDPEQTLLEYFVGDSAVYAFVVNRDDYRVLNIKKDFNLDSLVRVLRESIISPHARPLTDSLRNAAPVAYAQSATLLYEKLVAPAKPYLKSRVVMVPDGPLGYLPFEALLTKYPEKAYRFKDHAYLLHEHQISYCYSASLLCDMRDLRQRKDKQPVPAGAWLGMAPYFTGDTTLLADLFAFADNTRKDLRPLPFAGKEVANIAKLMQGKALYGKEANKKAFGQLAPQYRVLHLSTHGQANDRSGDYSFLAFGESKDSTGTDLLYVHDLYNYSLNADLVTLSACETGIGQMLRGEGIVSLARAFSYAGAKSIATSLWQVSDAKTQALMVDFYKGLVKKGEGRWNKDAALSEAKRKMAKSRDKSDPYYWAGFILIGDAGEL